MSETIIRAPLPLSGGFALLCDVLAFARRTQRKPSDIQTSEEENTERARAVRDIAEWFIRNPEFDIGEPDFMISLYAWSRVRQRWYSGTPHRDIYTQVIEDHQQDAFISAAARALMAGAPVGAVKKETTDSSFDVIRTVGPLELRAFVMSADRCQRVPTGEVKEVEVTEIPDDVKARYTRTERQAVMMTVCPPLLNVPDLDGLELPDIDEEEAHDDPF